jgi:hypothetical protein
MKKTTLVLHVAFLLLVQAILSSCCISEKSVSRWYYSAENLASITRPKRFYLLELKSIPQDNYPVEFQEGTVCLVVYGLDSRMWAVNDEFPWDIVPFPLPDESSWNLFDLSKGNWRILRVDRPLKITDPRIPLYQKASATSFLSNYGETKVLDLTQVYQKIENCVGVVLVGDKRCYFFHNSLNFNLKWYGLLYQAFFHEVFPHEVLMESNDFEDIEKAARRFAEQTRLAQEANEDEVSAPRPDVEVE